MKNDDKKTLPPGVASFAAVRRASVPLCCIETADPAHTIRQCLKAMNGDAAKYAIAQWDFVNGLRVIDNGKGQAINDASNEFVSAVVGNDAAQTITPTDYLAKFQDDARVPAKTLIFWHNMQRLINELPIVQGLWNLRDKFKARGVTLCMLAPNLTLPPELKQDVVIITEPLPGEAELTAIIDSVVADVGDKFNDAARLDIQVNKPHLIDTLRGLSGFAAEQVTAMSVRKTGIDPAGLWDRKKKMIEQTPGLSVWKGGETFDDLGGLSNLKTFLSSVLTSGKTPVRAIGFIDEIEKGMAGAGGDTSGTSQDQLQVFLKTMQDLAVPGIILLGHPGTGKSAIAKAAGNVANAPVIAIDTGAMKGSLVGESEGKIRAAMDVFQAVSQGKGLFIATCNKIASLPPELRRRFTLGTFFVDLPSREERQKIWFVWRDRYGINDEVLPDSTGWTGAEIKACCEVSFRTGLSLRDAAAFVVPVIKSAPDQVQNLRDMAHSRFISASYEGTYDKNRNTDAQTVTTGRQFDLA